MTDRELLKLLSRKPNQAMEGMTERYAPLAAAIAGRVLPGRTTDIEEVAADTMIRLWQNGETLRAETLRGFVITTARNLAVDRWRQLRRRAEVPLFDDDGADSAVLEMDLTGRALADYIRTLSPPDGEIFLRRYLLLESVPEIAERYHLTESAVRSRLHRIRNVLREEVPR